MDRTSVKGAPDPPRSSLPIAATSSSLRSLKASESVARDIVDDIVVRRLREGDSLLAGIGDAAAVRRQPRDAREALRLLEVQGLISIRRGPGGGPIVGTVDPANLGRTSTLYYHLAGATYAELFDAWVVCDRMLVRAGGGEPGPRGGARRDGAVPARTSRRSRRRSRSSWCATPSSTPSWRR